MIPISNDYTNPLGLLVGIIITNNPTQESSTGTNNPSLSNQGAVDMICDLSGGSTTKQIRI